MFLAASAVIIVLGALVYAARDSLLQYVPMLSIGIVLLTLQVYLPLLSATRNTGYADNLVASLYVVLRRTVSPVLSVLVWVAAALFPILFPKPTFAWLFLGIGIPLYVSSRLMSRVFGGLGMLLDDEDTP